MSSNSNEQSSTFAPARDEVASRAKGGRKKPSSRQGSSGSSIVTIVALIVAFAALGATLFLWEQGQRHVKLLDTAEQRIVTLENQLISTGDELNQSDAAVRVQLNLLDKEVRRLEQNRRKHKAAIDKTEKLSVALDKRTKSLAANTKDAQTQLTVLAASVDDLVVDSEQLAADLSKLNNLQQASSNIKKLQQENVSLDARIKSNEEWLASINAFRQQVNKRLNELQYGSTSNQQPSLQ